MSDPLARKESLPQAIIFDMDGVLLDSEPLHFEALNRVLRPEGYALTTDDNEHILGTTLEDTFAYIGSIFDLAAPMEEYFERYNSTVLEVLAGPLEPSPGVRDFIKSAREKPIPLAVASSSRRAWVETTLNSLGLLDRFQVVVSGEEIEHGKPAPDIYLRAAELVNANPSRCLAVEDAPNGILAATRAGMYVVAVRTPYTRHLDLPPCDRVVDSLLEVSLNQVSQDLSQRFLFARDT